MEPGFDFFGALRRMKARGEPVVQSDTTAPPPLHLPSGAVQGDAAGAVGPAGLALIKHFEGCARRRADGSFEAYPDPGTGGDPWTIGWGATGRGIARGTVWSQAQCDTRLEADLARLAHEVTRALGDAPTSPSQFDALVSFHYNTGAIAKATLTRLHKAGHFAEAADEFGKWVHAGGKRLPGLVRRRAAEARLYASNSPG